MTEVSAAIIRQQGKILICRRGPGGSCGMLWEFPGGKRDDPESPEACLIRELGEELGIKTKIISLFDEYEYAYPNQTIYFRFYATEIMEGIPEARVHPEITWVIPEEFAQYQFCPADERAVRKLHRFK